MSNSKDSAQILSSLSNAIKGDDIGSVESLLSTKPELQDLVAQNWQANPIFLAFNSKSLRVIKEIGRRKPAFANMKNREGNTVLHLAYATSVLVGIDTQLCLVKDDYNSSMIRLHTAIDCGQRDVVNKLLTACPESLETLTSQLETVFHVAVKNKKCDGFSGFVRRGKEA